MKHVVIDNKVNNRKRTPTLVDNETRTALGMITKRIIDGQKTSVADTRGFEDNLNELK